MQIIPQFKKNCPNLPRNFLFQQLHTLHKKYILSFLEGISLRLSKYVSSQIFEIIIQFLFVSAYAREKGIYVLKNGHYLLQTNTKNKNKQDKQLNKIVIDSRSIFETGKFFLGSSNVHEQSISIFSKYKIKQGDNFLISTPSINYLEKIKIRKIWARPSTRTEQKLITYNHKFKEFLLDSYVSQNSFLGNRGSKATNNISINRRFIWLDQTQSQIFQQHRQNVLNNDINMCTFDILQSYFMLVTMNYIQLEIGYQSHPGESTNSGRQSIQCNNSIVLVFRDIDYFLLNQQQLSRQYKQDELRQQIEIFSGLRMGLDFKPSLRKLLQERKEERKRQGPNINFNKTSLPSLVTIQRNFYFTCSHEKSLAFPSGLVLWKEQIYIPQTLQLIRQMRHGQKVFKIESCRKEQLVSLQQIKGEKEEKQQRQEEKYFC